VKIIHIPYCFYPDPVGGTEIYVESLAKQQQQQGYEIIVAAPAKLNQEYSHRGLSIRRFAVSSTTRDVRDLYDEGDESAAESFGRILDEELPDVVHVHAFSRGASLRLVREAKRRDLPVVFNYHTPTVSCQRGTLLRWGTDVCDGVVDVTKCTRCTLQAHGLSRIASAMLGGIPSGLGRIIGTLDTSGGLWTAARMTELLRIRQDVFRNLMAEVDHVVALCQWAKDLLLRNNVPESKITVSRQGLDAYMDQGPSFTATEGNTPMSHLRIAFLGRLDPTKGVHVLISALKQNWDLPARLDIFGVAQGSAGNDYLKDLRVLASSDNRINFRPVIPASDVIANLRNYDILAVPSQWLETGPRVVLEAFAAGVPVIGSNLGGIPELVENRVNGLLVEPHSINAWAQALKTLAEDRDLLRHLRSGIRRPKSMTVVAEEMRRLYTTVLQHEIPASV
jgi:glycosyltransferase involved in cell wall biosynthesis